MKSRVAGLVFAMIFAAAGTVDAAEPFDLSQYVMSGANGGRGGLPEVKIWLKQPVREAMKSGGHSWNYPAGNRPDNMHYSSWRFWQFGVSDALLQLICEQATDPSGGPQKLGPYFSQLTNSNLTCWSKTAAPRAGVVADITDTTPVSESCRADRYVFPGLTSELFFNGKAKFLLKASKNRRLEVELLSSNLSTANTKHLLSALQSLDGHPVLSFPDNARDQGPIDFIGEFSIERQPGRLKSP